jgi:hypothetical protein
MGPETNNDCASEGQQQTTALRLTIYMWLLVFLLLNRMS